MSVAKNISEENKFEIIKAFAELCNHYNGTNANLVAANSLNNLEILYNLLIVSRLFCFVGDEIFFVRFLQESAYFFKNNVGFEAVSG